MKKPLLLGIILTVCIVIVAFVFAQVYPVGMISYWKFDEGSGLTASDSVDGNDGTIYGATWTGGKVNGALSFDGVDDYVEIPHSTSLDITDQIAVSAWINLKSRNLQALGGTIIRKGAWPVVVPRPAWGFDIQYGKLRAFIYDEVSGYEVRGDTVLSAGEWYHVAFTYDGSEIQIYLDGELEGNPTPHVGHIASTPAPVWIGRKNGVDFFDGKIDEVAIYSRALTADEIQQHYLNGSYEVECVDPPTGMVSWWDGDSVSGTTATDIQNGNDGTLENGATTVPGKVGDAFSFDGVNDYVKVSKSSNLEPSNITVDAWVKSSNPGNAGGPRYILAKGARLCERASYALWARGSSRGIEFYISDGNAPARFSPAAPQAAVWDGNWHHVAGTYDGNKIRLYLDGVEIGDGTPETIQIGYGEVMTTTNDLSLGRYDGPGTCKLSYTGLLDEVEIFDRALSADEIQDIYLAGSAGKCKVAPVIEVTIDIKPGSDPNSINLGDHGLLPVAILGSANFDVTEINPTSIELGGVSLALRGSQKKGIKLAYSYDNVDEDIYKDMMIFFDVQQLVADKVLVDTTIALELTGNLDVVLGGTPIKGTDSVNIVPII